MARSLHEARRQAAENLDRQVDELTAGESIAEDHPHWILIADGKQLRGLPASGANSASSAIPGSRPGESLGLFDDGG